MKSILIRHILILKVVRICRVSKKLFEKGITDTKSETEYENLEPWVQWPSVHTGKTYGEHKVFRLGDFINSTDEQFFEQVEKAGFCIGAVSP
jgi:hypothetical protein